VADSTPDHDEIRRVLDLYVAGANGDVGKLEEAFHVDATMTGHIGAALDTFTPIADFIAMVGRNPGLAGARYSAEIRSIDVTGDVGVAVLAETDYFGCDFVDYFTLARIDGRWQIIAKTYAHTGGEPSHRLNSTVPGASSSPGASGVTGCSDATC
jgi:hypothetical protein